MDKNSVIGLVIIGGILMGWMYFSRPSAEQLAIQKRMQDSTLAYVKVQETLATTHKTNKSTHTAGSGISTDSIVNLSDSAKSVLKKSVYGDFADASTGDNKTIVLENEVMKVNVSPKGGRISSVELKKYKTYDGKPLMLFNADSSTQKLTFATYNKSFATDSLYFTPVGDAFILTGKASKSLAMRLYAGSKEKYIEYVYTLTGDEYMMGCKINTVGMQSVIPATKGEIELNWQMKTPTQEQNKQNQQRASTIYYNTIEDGVKKISEGTEDKISFDTKMKWVAFKQQFFTSIIIADNTFEKHTEVESAMEKTSAKYIANYAATFSIPYKGLPNESFGMRFYFGPNHYQTLKKYDVDIERQINLGWKIFGWINRFLVIPIFNVLNSFNWNYGIIILVLTIILKLLLLPIAYKTVLSSAKMKVLKPEIDELNEKFKDAEPVKKQQATMALYKQAGVNPMAGCIPVLLQMPILIALFNFFPASIELRQQGFLWAHDLSSYDSVYNFGFSVPWYGDHVSLFALLMTGSTLLYTWSNSQLMGTQQQMPGMKWMMYLMPIMFLGFLNNYSAGLSWYYFLANMITFGQTWVMQKFVIDHDKLHAKIQANKKKPVTKSKFQERLEQMTKERQQQTPAKKK